MIIGTPTSREICRLSVNFANQPCPNDLRTSSDARGARFSRNFCRADPPNPRRYRCARNRGANRTRSHTAWAGGRPYALRLTPAYETKRPEIREQWGRGPPPVIFFAKDPVNQHEAGGPHLTQINDQELSGCKLLQGKLGVQEGRSARGRIMGRGSLGFLDQDHTSELLLRV